jgi:membrane protein implicated in regulation of membrane protease activity
MMTAIYWLYAGIVLIILEVMTPGLVSIFFGLSALVVALITWLVPGLTQLTQWLMFSAFSVLFIALLRKTLKQTFSGTSEVTEDMFDSFSGKRAVVTESITPIKDGRVEFNGSGWMAEAEEALDIGTPVRIKCKKNLTLFVEKDA